MASQITGMSTVCSAILFRHTSKKTSKPRVTGLCEENPLVTGGFPSQRASVSIWWRHHAKHWIKTSTLLFLTKAVRYVTVTDNVFYPKNMVTLIVDHNGMCFKCMYGWMRHIYMCIYKYDHSASKIHTLTETQFTKGNIIYWQHMYI